MREFQNCYNLTILQIKSKTDKVIMRRLHLTALLVTGDVSCCGDHSPGQFCSPRPRPQQTQLLRCGRCPLSTVHCRGWAHWSGPSCRVRAGRGLRLCVTRVTRAQLWGGPWPRLRRAVLSWDVIPGVMWHIRDTAWLITQEHNTGLIIVTSEELKWSQPSNKPSYSYIYIKIAGEVSEERTTLSSDSASQMSSFELEESW